MGLPENHANISIIEKKINELLIFQYGSKMISVNLSSSLVSEISFSDSRFLIEKLLSGSLIKFRN